MSGALSTLRQRRLSPATYRRITLLAVWALGFIILTGGAVRITGSGLGCPDWPTCGNQHVVAPWQYHAMVEFGNRVVTGIVSVAVILAVLGALFRSPRRRDLTWLSWGLVLGVLAQIVLGGETVKHNLAPGFVMSHFLLSMLLLWDAVVLHHRAKWPDDHGPAVPLVSREQVIMGRILPVAAGLVIALGTVVTSSGPHGGDPKAKRLSYSLHDVARLHGSAVMLFLGLTVVTLAMMVYARVPAAVIHRGEVLLLVLIAQGTVGYVQYFTGVPAWLVAIHIGLAATLWGVTVRFALGLFDHPPVAAAPPPAPSRLTELSARDPVPA
ncbi:MAG TPA: COX15/CtaA family protein [Acidimicrobiales bacterium]|nr:COX15/CtaA family protein [Acidimicrobiales bacterium]